MKKLVAITAVLVLFGWRAALGFAPGDKGKHSNDQHSGNSGGNSGGQGGQTGEHEGEHQDGDEGNDGGDHHDGEKGDGDHHDGEKGDGDHHDGEKGDDGENGEQSGGQTSGATARSTASRTNPLISKDAAVKAATQQIHGTVTSVTLKQRDEIPVYDVILNTNSGRIGVVVDARSGTVHHIEVR